MIRSLVQYAVYFAKAIQQPDVRRVLVEQRKGSQLSSDLDREVALNQIADHLGLAQDHGADDGLGSYHLIKGWSASYPETTGYIIPTLIALGDRLHRQDLKERAIRAADWLLSIQRKEGGWQGGRVDEKRPAVVFNTAQVIRGMIAAHRIATDRKFLDSAVRAADWIVAVQEPNGAWKQHNFLQQERVYDSYVSAPLLRLYNITTNSVYREAALKNLDLVLSKQRSNGWFMDADNTIKHNERPITHTIAYTLDGLMESHSFTNDQRYLFAASRAADVLLEKFMSDGSLNGRYDRDWNGTESTITTGNAQLAIVWSRLHKITGDDRYSKAASRMIHHLIAIQRTSKKGPIGSNGAITGSFPLWGRYEKFAYPNWAQKYFADAILSTEGIFTEQ